MFSQWSDSLGLNFSISAFQLYLPIFWKNSFLKVPGSLHSSQWEWIELSMFQHVALKNLLVISWNLSCATLSKVKPACLKVRKLYDLHKPWTPNLVHSSSSFTFGFLLPSSCFPSCLLQLFTSVVKPVSSLMECYFSACGPHLHKKIIRHRKAINFYSWEGPDINKIDKLSNLLSHSADKTCWVDWLLLKCEKNILGKKVWHCYSGR